MPRVLITDRVDPVCIDMLQAQGIDADLQTGKSAEELKELAQSANGWIIRSGTQISGELIQAAEQLQVIGRAGVGVDNIDLEAATRRGILVINAPDGNTISTAEHTCAMLMALTRNIPQANASMVQGKWDRKSFTGAELYEKTLGIVGVGKIGQAVAQRMQAFGMRTIGYDPVLSKEVADRLGIELVSLDELTAGSDYITVHTPLNKATRHMFDAARIAQCKPGVGFINCARGGIIDEAALIDALESGQVGGAALDVYSAEPPPPELERLLTHPHVVATPHIAASTSEAQRKVAAQVTEQVIGALQGKAVSTPVNAMAIKLAAQPALQPYLQLADQLGQLAGQLTDGRLHRVAVHCHGERLQRYAEVVTIAALRGVLAQWIDEPVNLVNAQFMARELGLEVEERKGTDAGSYTNLIEVEVQAGGEIHQVAGAVFRGDEPRLVRMDDYPVEVQPVGDLLIYHNEDRPGMVAAVASILAQADINIGNLALGRREEGARALAIIHVDEPIPSPVLAQIAALEGFEKVRLAHIEG